MTIFGLGPGAQVIILQALSAYSAILSAYSFARPVLRGQTLSVSKAILSEVTTEDADVQGLLDTARGILDERIKKHQPLDRRANKLGIGLLVVSILLLTGAVLLQIATDPLFNPTETHDAMKPGQPATAKP
jgi:hypothetical protein